VSLVFAGSVPAGLLNIQKHATEIRRPIEKHPQKNEADQTESKGGKEMTCQCGFRLNMPDKKCGCDGKRPEGENKSMPPINKLTGKNRLKK
jgi:hypothetical protein